MVSEWYLTERYSEWSNDILNGTYKKLFRFFVNDILNGIPFRIPLMKNYKLPLGIPLSPAKIPLNGPMVLNGIQWYSVILNGLFL